MRDLKRIAALAAALLLAVPAVPASAAESSVGESYFLEWTLGEDTLYRGDEKVAAAEFAALKREIGELARDFERRVSLRFASSELSALNAASAGREIALSADTRALLLRAEELSALTSGAFDPAAGELVELWGFSPDHAGGYSRPRPAPAADAVAAALDRLENAELAFTGSGATKSEDGAKYDCGGIAKGYLADRISDMLREAGVTDGIFSLMSNHYAFGLRREGQSARKWRIGISDPRSPASECLTFEASDRAVTTSGDYERYYVYGGRRYCHIIDPRTGAPADKGVMSVTVVSDDGALGDALATAGFSLGAKRTLELAEELGVQAVVICTDYKYYATEGFDVRPSAEVYEGYPACRYARGERENAPDVAEACEEEARLYREKSHLAEWVISGVCVASAAGLVIYLIVKRK